MGGRDCKGGKGQRGSSMSPSSIIISHDGIMSWFHLTTHCDCHSFRHLGHMIVPSKNSGVCLGCRVGFPWRVPCAVLPLSALWPTRLSGGWCTPCRHPLQTSLPGKSTAPQYCTPACIPPPLHLNPTAPQPARQFYCTSLL